MYSSGSTPPSLVIGIGVLLIAGCSVVVALIWGDGVAAVAYQWGLASPREAPAQVVNTITTYRRRSGTLRQVVLLVDGNRETINLHDGELFHKLAPGEPIRERIVADRVVAIRVGAQELQIEDNLNWLIGLVGGILLGVAVLVIGIRTGLANGFFSRGAIGYPGSAGGPELLVILASFALGVTGISIGVVEWVTNGVPPLPVVASIIAASTIWGGFLLIRAKRTNQALGEVGSRVTSGELITALIVPAKKGGWDVSFIGDGRVPKDLVLNTLDAGALSTIENLIADIHKKRPVDVSFAWYPWESKGGRGSRGEFMIFLTEHKDGEYIATLDGRPEVTASSPTFEGLSTAVETAMASQGEADPQHLQACIAWNRTLTNFGYVHSVP
jgi:hypothetical protein